VAAVGAKDVSARPWRKSPVNKAVMLYERDVREMYKNIALLTSGGRPLRVGIFNRLLTK
jgi:hypothetical protein